MKYRVRLIETDVGWAVSCLDLPGFHSQGSTREEALQAIHEAIADWLAVEAEESGIKSAEILEIAV
jgi:predicted RNase H-like HicB family nuclease